MTQSTFKLKKSERKIIAANRAAMLTRTPCPPELRPSMSEMDLQKVVNICSRWEKRIGWTAGDPVTNKWHRFLIDLKFDLWRVKQYCS